MSVNLPPSLNLGDVKKSAIPNCKSSFQRIRSDNATYGAGDVVRIEIPCGRKGDYLHGQDSFLEFKFTPTFAVTAGSMSIDANAYSIFKSLKVYHGSNLLINQQFSNRLWNALFDAQVSGSQRQGKTCNLAIATDTVMSRSSNLYGIVLTSASTYGCSFVLPCSLIGSLSDKATPLGWMGASSIYIELEIEAMSRIITTRTSNNVLIGAVGGNTTANPTLTSFVLKDIYYNAKISQLDPMYDDLLLKQFGGQPILIPGVDYRGEMKTISASASAFNDKFSFQLSSVKFLLWWLTNSSTANGNVSTATAYNYNQAISQRQCGVCKEYFLTMNGSQFPATPISMSIGSDTTDTNMQYGAVAFNHLLRAFNQNSTIDGGGVLCKTLYAEKNSTIATDDTTARRFIGAIDLDRFDSGQDRYMQGLNTVGQNFCLNVAWDTAPAEAQNLYAFVQYDCAYELVDGLLNVRL